MLHEFWKTTGSDMNYWFLCVTMPNKSSYGLLVKKPDRYEDSNDMIVKGSNENCIGECTIGTIFRLCTRCSAYYC